MRSQPASWITLVGLASIILACGGDGITPTTPDIDGLGGALATEKKPPGKGKTSSDEIPLTVRFDVPGLPSGAVTGDGGGDYVDGKEGVEAFIRSNGNFWLSVQDVGGRQLCLTFPAGTGTPPFGADCVDGRMGMSNGGRSLEGGLPAMDPDSTMMAVITVVWVGPAAGSTDNFRWSLSFGGGCGASDGSGNRVTIKRTGENTWTIDTIASGGNAILCADEIGTKGRIIRTEEWTGAMPFSLEAVVQNP